MPFSTVSAKIVYKNLLPLFPLLTPSSNYQPISVSFYEVRFPFSGHICNGPDYNCVDFEFAFRFPYRQSEVMLLLMKKLLKAALSITSVSKYLTTLSQM